MMHGARLWSIHKPLTQTESHLCPSEHGNIFCRDFRRLLFPLVSGDSDRTPHQPLRKIPAGRALPPPVFSVTNAINYLMDTQNPDGSFDNGEMYTDSAARIRRRRNSRCNKGKIYRVYEDKNEISFLLTDNERRVILCLPFERTRMHLTAQIISLRL